MKEKTYLSHMSWRIRVLCTENRANTIYSLRTTCNLELFVKLRRLGQVGLLSKIRQLENIGASLRRSTNQTGRMETLKPVLFEVATEIVFDGGLYFGNCSVDWCSF
jgi:hypothetical protein